MLNSAMKCPLCGHEKSHKHGLTSIGSQRYFCTKCRQSFTDTFDTLYYRRQVSEEDVRIVLQAHAEGSSLRGIGRISGLAYDTVASIVQSASQKAQMVHNAEVSSVDTDAIAADELWSFALKKQKHCFPEELEVGDCWIAVSLAQLSGLILCARAGKRNDELAIELARSTEDKTDCQEWHTDGWGGYERVLSDEVDHYISKALTQRLERTNGTLRQQTGRWHRRQNKFGKAWEQTKVTLRLVISYFNWIWRHCCLGTTAAQRAELTDHPWTWNDIATYPTLL